MRDLLLALAVLLTVTGCGGGQKNAAMSGEAAYTPRYASGFEIYSSGNSSVIEIRNPWQGADNIVYKVFLSVDGELPPEGFEGEVVSSPIKSAVCMSSSYVAFLDALGCDSVVSGVSGLRYISSENVRARAGKGLVSEVGHDNGVNYELIAGMRPDVVFVYGLNGENTVLSGKLREMGAKVVYVGDYVENSPLGKAEWLVFMGEFLGRRAEAVTLFDSISGEYERVRDIASQVGERPKVMLNSPWRDSWFVPGDRSYMVRLLSDAGADYACAGVDDDRSRPISIETAFLAASSSDFWVGPGAVTTKAELISENPRFSDIKAVKEGRIYNNNARRTPEGGSDFWESGTVYPNIALKDMISIFHPELLPGHELYYFLRLE